MNYTQAQLLKLTGMSLDRLRHWRKEIPGLKQRAGRKAELSFEEVALLAVLSRATDALGLSVTLFASKYDDLLADFQENPDIGDKRIVLWLSPDKAVIGEVTNPPAAEALAMLEIAPVLARMVAEVQRPASQQLSLFSAEA
jgi:hypothetical protein